MPKKFFFLFLLSSLFLACSYQSKNHSEDATILMSIDEFTGNPTLSFHQILLDKKNWIHKKSKVVSKTYKIEPIWFKVSFQKKDITKDKKWFFIPGRPLIDSITFYRQKNHAWKKELYGFMIPRSKRIIEHHENIIPIILKDILTHTYYIKIKNRATLELPFQIISEKKFWVKSHSNISFMGILYGGIIALIFYNLFLFFSLKQKSYLFYTLSVLTALIVQSILTGHFSFYLLPEHPNVSFYLFYNLIFINIILSVEFCKLLLNIKKGKNFGYLFLISLQIISLLALFSYFFLSFPNYGFTTLFVVLLYSFGLLFIGIINWLKGNKIAKFFNLAWGVYMLGIIVNILKTLEIIPTNWFSIYFGHIASYLETILLSFILGYQYKLLKEEKENLQLHFTENLQQQVTQKTQELTLALSQKNELLSEVHHRVKNNLQVIFSLFNLQERRVKNTETKKALEAGKNRVKSMSLLHEHLYKNNSFKQIDSKKYLEDLIAYLTNLYRKKVAIEQQISSIAIANDFAIPLGLITTEILSNSFKYAFPSEDKKHQIIIQFYQKEKNYHLLIADNGIGFNTDKKTNSLGRQLISGMCNQLNGQLFLDTTNGTSYTFIFPINK